MPGATGVVNVIVCRKTGVSTHLVATFQDGVQTFRVGTAPDADFEIEFLDEEDGARFIRGELDVSLAIERLRWDGDIQLFAGIAPLFDTEAYHLMQRRVAEQTDFA
jgi:hypothetical protein